ncbi:protein phosphatase 1 regulatory subunit 36 isoform X1 [Strongylocentrotus purpuratus]|uniref:Protein phosphatase 1 regulatory subunit 36 n=1 Tax=Strongylocentrotus purpuratus TaxID=7668 RepID=A0A7M7PQJ0_STRPU|nr:protein phosphatase 1 regulatory subunit 36 isoform X1 [Strongylocentrotus purpuratus]
MAKTVSISDETSVATSGKWFWKEETQSLEFQASATQSLDQKDKKNQRKKNHTFGEAANKKDRATPNRLDGKGQGGSKGNQRIGARSARSNKVEKETTVTLQRVKSVALFMLNEVNFPTDSFEMCLFELDQFDEFLLGLLNYFSSYFDRSVLENRPKQMTTEPSFAEQAAMAEITERMDVAQRHLAQSYCILILGLGLHEHHHMGSGMKRQSSTYKDREIYETLYKFCVYLVWLVFRRKDHDLINKELGRILRSDVFNPALRVKNSLDEDAENEEEAIRDMFTFTPATTPAERRRQNRERPSITNIIKTRSPVLKSLLPTPKEANEYLFGKMTLDASGKSQTPDSNSPAGKGRPSFFKKNIGIIGEPLNQFNPQTLAPVGSEQDEETEEDQTKREGFAGTPTKPAPMQGGVSRQMTSLSQATDVFSDDED